ncbi:hypothetical protein UCDDS831_g04746 [Diplodia seriata]|uniref:Spt20-like SEP domain-containing protein n=1 Tax=Diplodia seriata TaxID=420778 RepID=A0A0G2ED46_9PEZI|nr:hypothetical protein UCDDS831_g04746 [Diplodia seriata]
MSTAGPVRPMQALRQRRESQRPSQLRSSTRNAHGDAEEAAAADKVVEKPLVINEQYILKKFKGSPPSLIVHLHQHHFRFEQQDGNFPYNSPMRPLLQHIRDGTIPHFILEEMLRAGVTFYEGCLIVQLVDHRSADAKTQAGPQNTSSKEGKTAQFSIHNWNEYLTPSPWVPYPSPPKSSSDESPPPKTEQANRPTSSAGEIKAKTEGPSADDANAANKSPRFAADQNFMLFGDSAASTSNAAQMNGDGEGMRSGAAAFEPRFSRFKTLENIKIAHEENERIKKEEEARQAQLKREQQANADAIRRREEAAEQNRALAPGRVNQHGSPVGAMQGTPMMPVGGQMPQNLSQEQIMRIQQLRRTQLMQQQHQNAAMAGSPHNMTPEQMQIFRQQQIAQAQAQAQMAHHNGQGSNSGTPTPYNAQLAQQMRQQMAQSASPNPGQQQGQQRPPGQQGMMGANMGMGQMNMANMTPEQQQQVHRQRSQMIVKRMMAHYGGNLPAPIQQMIRSGQIMQAWQMVVQQQAAQQANQQQQQQQQGGQNNMGIGGGMGQMNMGGMGMGVSMGGGGQMSMGGGVGGVPAGMNGMGTMGGGGMTMQQMQQVQMRLQQQQQQAAAAQQGGAGGDGGGQPQNQQAYMARLMRQQQMLAQRQAQQQQQSMMGMGGGMGMGMGWQGGMGRGQGGGMG